MIPEIGYNKDIAIGSMLSRLKNHHPPSYHHSVEVKRYALELAKPFSSVDFELIKHGALLHDIGKNDVPALILEKKFCHKRLDKDEKKLLHRHRQLGYERIVQQKEIDHRVALIALDHAMFASFRVKPSEQRLRRYEPHTLFIAVADLIAHKEKNLDLLLLHIKTIQLFYNNQINSVLAPLSISQEQVFQRAFDLIKKMKSAQYYM